MKTQALLLLLFIMLGALRAQPVAFKIEEITLPAASPMATIDWILEDSKGFMWFGAYTGLYRFDGYELLHFRHDPKAPHSISDNKVHRILEDPKGNLWVGTQVGLNYFDVATRQFRDYTDTAECGLGKVVISGLAFDRFGVLWVATVGGLYRFDPEKAYFNKMYPQGVKGGADLRFIAPADNGIYFASIDGMFHIDEKENIRDIPLPDTSDIIVSFYHQPGGWYWVGTMKSLWRFDPEKEQFREIEALRNIRVFTITEWAGRLLVFTSKGMYMLDDKLCQVTGPQYVLENGIRRQADHFPLAYTASNGIVWLLSDTRKVFKIDPHKAHFHHAPIDLMGALTTPAAFCELFEFNPGELLLPRPEGASLFNVHTGALSPFPSKPTYNIEGWEKGVSCFWEEPDGRLWIGTVGGLFLFDKNAGKFINPDPAFNPLETLGNISVRKLYRDRKGRLWVASWGNGLFRVDFSKQTVRTYNNSPAYRHTYMYGSRSILEARDGTLWFGTRGGLLKYLEEKDTFLVYRNIPNDSTSMSENTAFCIYEDAKGNIWTGSYGGGLNCLDVKTGKFRHFTTDDGLLNNNIFSLLPDGKGRLWLLTFNGITLFDPERRSFQNFTHEQGLLNSTFEGFLYGKSAYSNTFFFGGTKGVDYFNPDSITLKQQAPPVFFTAFRMFNEPVHVGAAAGAGRFFLEQDINVTKEITLRYDQNVISFDYAALDYSSPKTVRYAYQLVGFDTAWQYVGDRRSVTFTNLNPDTYILKVKASNGDGVWDPAESNVCSIKITVTPPWWRTWWFRLTVLMAIGAVITAFYNYRVRQIREREAIKSALNQRIAQVKMEALRSQMNPHFVFNCLSSLKLFVEKNETEKASDHISKFATLLRRVLDDARTETETVTLERELDTLQRYVELEMIRFKDKFEFRMEVSPEVDVYNTEIPPLILQPYVENAILHGLQHKKDGKGLLQVKVGQTDGWLQIMVEDNGIGREAARAIKAKNLVVQVSHGLNVTAERLEYYSQKYHAEANVQTIDLLHENGTAAGTRVILSFQTE